jgi:hypothetical protein
VVTQPASIVVPAATMAAQRVLEFVPGPSHSCQEFTAFVAASRLPHEPQGFFGIDAVDGSSPGTRVPSMWVLLADPTIRRSQGMQMATTVGLDIAKSVFQVHGVDADGNVVFCRQLKRRYVLTFFQKLPPCLIGIEACASSHYWSRELQALGHTVRLMPPAYALQGTRRIGGVKEITSGYLT